MSADLLGALRLVHRVTGFLIRLSPTQLTGLAEGRLALALGTEPDTAVAPLPVPDTAVAPVPVPVPDTAVAPVPVPVPLPQPPARPVRGKPGAPSSRPAAATVDHAGIAAILRKQDTVDEGHAYLLQALPLRGRKPLKNDVIAVARELKLTLPAGVTVDDAVKKLIHHAIGNRRRFDGLRP